MAVRTFAFALLAAAAASAPAFADDAIRIEHAAARVVVIPENRGDVVYTIQPGRAGLPPIQMRHDGGVTVLDGGLGGRGFFGAHQSPNCRGGRDHPRVFVPGHGEFALQDLPVVTAHVPMNAKVSAGEAVFGDVGPTQSLDLGDMGCGDWTVADVRGPAHYHLAGSGDVRAHNAGDTIVNIAGSGDLYFESAGSLDAHIAGSGDVNGKAVNGAIGAKIAGSGDVVIQSGRAPTLSASIAGSGDVKFHGEAGSVNASIVGSGDVDVARVTGPVAKHIAGSGEVHVGR